VKSLSQIPHDSALSFLRISSLILLALTMFVSTETSCQSWRPATVLMASGDSVRGQVQFSDPDISPSEVVFRKEGETASITLTTKEVRLFVVRDPTTIFETLEARIAYYSTAIIMENADPVTARENISVFAERLVSDERVVLYSVQDRNKDERFFIRKGGILTELMNVTYQIYKNGSTNVVEEIRYNNQLRALLADCSDRKKSNVAYTARGISKAVTAYIACKGGTNQVPVQPSGERFSIGIAASYTSVLTPRDAEYMGTLVGGTMQFLSRKNLNNRFIWIDIAAVGNAEYFGPVMVSLMGGTYFGTRQIQPLAGVGLSMVGGGIMVGTGLAYRKRVILNGNLRLHLGGVGYELRLSLLPKLWGRHRS
jgi:hypothetical protein